MGDIWGRTSTQQPVDPGLCLSNICHNHFFFFFYHHFYFPAQLVGGFTHSDLPEKPWSQVSSLLPPGTCLQFLSRIGFSIPTAHRFSSNVANSRSRAFRLLSNFYARKNPYEYTARRRKHGGSLNNALLCTYPGMLPPFACLRYHECACYSRLPISLTALQAVVRRL